MRVELGAHVRTSDGKDVGTIEKLIVDPRDGDVVEAVVRKGFFLPDDVRIPVEAMEAGRGGEVHLTYTADQVEELPKFVEAEYTSPTFGYRSPYGYPATGLLWPAAYPCPATAPAYEGYGVGSPVGEGAGPRGTPDRTSAVIDEGSDVMSRDGEKVGEVETVVFDTQTGQPTRFVVRKGFLFTKDLELPASAIESIADDVVTLNLDKDQVERAAAPPARR